MKTTSKIHQRLFVRGLILLLIFSIVGPVGVVLAGTITVCSSGCDYESIQDAVDNAFTGDIIEIDAGTFNENVTIDKNLTLQGAGDGSTIVDGGGTSSVFLVKGPYLVDIVVTISDMTIMNGNAASGSGGGIINYGMLTLENCIVKNNGTAWSGGGIYNVAFDSSGILKLINSTVIDNNADRGGGGIYSGGGTVVELTDSTVSGNNAGSNGGGIAIQGGMLTIVNSTVSRNKASTLYDKQPGGGIYSTSGGMMTLINSTISGNESATGGGIANYGTLRLASSTVTDNIASYTYAAGGIQNWGAGSTTLKNTIVAGNTANYGDLRGPSGSWHSEGYNLIGNNTSSYAAVEGDKVGTSGSPIDPLLSSLQDNGGHTETHALLEGSPAIDAGNPDGCTNFNDNLLTADQRGVARPQGETSDIGAFELPFGDGTVGTDGGKVADLAGSGASFSVGPGVLHMNLSAIIDVIPDPDISPPPGFIGPSTQFVNFTLIPNPSPLQFPGATITLPLVLPLTPGLSLPLFKFDPITGTLSDTGIVGTVDLDGTTITFSGVTDFSIFVGFSSNQPPVAVCQDVAIKVCWHHDDLHVEGKLYLPEGVWKDTLSPAGNAVILLADEGITDRSVDFEIKGKKDEKWEYKDKENVYGNIKEFKIEWKEKAPKFDYKGDLHIHTHSIAENETTLCIHSEHVSGAFTVAIDGTEIAFDEYKNIIADILYDPQKPDNGHVHFTLPFKLTSDMTINVGGAVELTINVANYYEKSYAKFKLVSAFDPVSFPDGTLSLPDMLEFAITIGDDTNEVSGDDLIGVEKTWTKQDDKHWEYKPKK